MKKNKNKIFNISGNPRNVALAVILFVVALGLINRLTDYTHQITKLSYSQFLRDVKDDKIKSVKISGNDVIGEFKDGKRFETVIAQNQKNWDILQDHNVEFSVISSSASSGNMWFFFLFSLLLIIPLTIWYIVRYIRQSGNSGSSGGPGIFTMGKSRAKMFLPATIKENFSSVAGAAEAKEELSDVIDYLKDPVRYQRLGAKITRGILLIGEPGNGKTLLARAVAGEANCPFFSISGSDFIEVFVGVGASRVRDLFSQARKNAPCIVFIDEIDAVGRHRGSGLGGGNDEREQTLNQLLTEMDGFEVSEDPVIVLAATNRPDVLDKALLRPGRFDRRVLVPFPDLNSREEILRVHAKKVKIGSDVDLKKIARGTPGFSGADLASLINEAAINATRNKQDKVHISDFEEARDKITMGKASKNQILSEEERKITAWHEAGHALVRLLMPQDTDPLHKITILPRGSALGVTHFMPERDKYLRTKYEMLSSIKTALGGRIAEEVACGSITGGAYSDFKAATEIARQMVCYFGMSDELGKAVYLQNQGEFVYSQHTAQKIDEEVKKILDACYQEAKDLIVNNRDKLDKLAQKLLEVETMYASEVYELLGIEPREDHKLV
ncbi:MAG TPA: ATP-dependent zinc metalloprotease FtsH [Candidatus Babeliales bacterium]|nr:ATP-dependent zinc metalloprotease FtsH [Candidatus Babeliales bacterium]